LVSGDGFPLALPWNQNVAFGENWLQARVAYEMALKSRSDTGAAVNAVMATMTPRDLVPVREGLWAQFMQRGVRYGCDPALLPVPPLG
jgi:hypothetical protein